MNIGVDAREFTAAGPTGIGRYLVNLLSPLAERAEHAWVLFAHRAEWVPPALRRPAVRVVELPARPTPWIDQIVLPRLAARAGVDVFFSPYYKIPLAGRFRRILTVHDIMFLRRRDYPALKRWACARQLQAAGAKADTILVDSDFTGCDLADWLPAQAAKIRRLYPDLNARWMTPPPPEDVARVRRQYAADAPFLLYVGNFKPHKNVPLLVDAFARLARERAGDGWRLLLVGGDADHAPALARRIATLGMDDRIGLHRQVSDTDLRALYAAAEWCVTASTYEGFGYPLVEAMAAGCPVLCHPCAAIPEVVGAAALSIAAPTVDGVAAALRQALALPPDARQRVIAQGRERAARFAPGSAAAAFARVLAADG